ncbi:M23 family metallopeptidase [Spirosoma luteum]|uniref:M23 family metallopeptidase n=1 Tax=Spirosoma luteum TaxID=431553 RepID=UPI0012F8085E|nr:M23 family metallopeptidase [Spirosoma luteum]
MLITFRGCSLSVIGLLAWVQTSVGQTGLSKSDGAFPAIDSLAQETTIPLSDSLMRVRDSLEVVLLRTTKTYQQVERLVDRFPPESKYLDLLPSVLPVDVPLQAFRISSPFGLRLHPIHRQKRFHGGVDVKAPLGMSVKATAAGIVKRVGHDPALGVFVQLQHAFGFETTYGHLTGYCVKPGQSLTRNQELGRVGQTGLATGPHLHYVIKKNGSVVDPFDFCFLLRRRLWFYEVKSKTKGASASVPEGANCLFSKEE